jgi:phosphate:Na+ symporter
LTILGGVALTLFGVQQVRESVTQALGPQLRGWIEHSTHRSWQAFMAGIAVTSLTQSATATALIVASFAARNLIPLTAALAVLLGADVGTTLVAQVVSLDFGWLGPVFVFLGMLTVAWCPQGRLKHGGGVLIGLGIMLVGLVTIEHAADPIAESELVRSIMKSLASDMIMTFIIGTIITWLAQSSLAIVLLVMSFASAKVMGLETALILVLSTPVGSAITPLILNMNQKNEAKLVALGSFLMRLLACVAVLPFIHPLMMYVDVLGASIGRKIVNFHTIFSVARALVFLPFLTPIALLLRRVFPWQRDLSDPSVPRYLDERDLNVPSVALAAAERETLRLGDLVLAMLEDVQGVFEFNEPGRLERLQAKDNQVDKLYEQIKFYLAKLSREAMSDEQATRHVDLLMFITNLEHIGDIIVKNLCELAQKKWRHSLWFSNQGWTEILAFHKHVCDNFRLAMNVFHSGDPTLARELVRQKEALQRETFHASGSHFERLRLGLMESLRSSSVHLDVIRDLRRINDHLTSVAYSILDAHGALQSRIRD